MRTLEYVRATDAAHAVELVAGDPTAAFLAGGTTQLDLMKDGVLSPGTLVDITRLPLHTIENSGDILRVGALVTMEELAADRTVAERVPFVREALLAGASTQLRNMATIGEICCNAHAAGISAIPPSPSATRGHPAQDARPSTEPPVCTPSSERVNGASPSMPPIWPSLW